MTDTVTERIARAICKRDCELQEMVGDLKSCQECKYWECEMETAEAALLVLSDLGVPIDKLLSGEYVAVPVEPTPKIMDEAPLRAKIHGVGSFTAREVWSAMIQAHKAESG